MILDKATSDSIPTCLVSFTEDLVRRFGRSIQVQRIEPFPDYIQVIYSRRDETADFQCLQEVHYYRDSRKFSRPSYWHEIQI